MLGRLRPGHGLSRLSCGPGGLYRNPFTAHGEVGGPAALPLLHLLLLLPVFLIIFA